MNTTAFNNICSIPALFVSGSFIVSVVIAIIISIIIITPPGME